MGGSKARTQSGEAKVSKIVRDACLRLQDPYKRANRCHVVVETAKIAGRNVTVAKNGLISLAVAHIQIPVNEIVLVMLQKQ